MSPTDYSFREIFFSILPLSIRPAIREHRFRATLCRGESRFRFWTSLLRKIKSKLFVWLSLLFPAKTFCRQMLFFHAFVSFFFLGCATSPNKLVTHTMVLRRCSNSLCEKNRCRCTWLERRSALCTSTPSSTRWAQECQEQTKTA